MFNGVWPASVSSGNCQDHERPEGHDDPDACTYMRGFDVFIPRLPLKLCVSPPEPVPLRV